MEDKAYIGGPDKTPWENFLDDNYCKAHPLTGNRPCDDGDFCDVCHTEEAQELYKVNYLKEELVMENKDDLKKVNEVNEPEKMDPDCDCSDCPIKDICPNAKGENPEAEEVVRIPAEQSTVILTKDGEKVAEMDEFILVGTMPGGEQRVLAVHAPVRYTLTAIDDLLSQIIKDMEDKKLDSFHKMLMLYPLMKTLERAIK